MSNEDPTGAGPTTAQYLDQLSKRIDDLDRRIATRKPSSREKITAWVAFIGGFISLATGGFTIYDKTVAQRQAQEAARYAQFQDHIARIQALTAQMQLASFNKNDAERSANLTALNAQKVPVYNDAVSLLTTLRRRPGSLEHMVMAQEAANQGELQRALAYAETATGIGPEYQRSEAFRMHGALLVQFRGPEGMARARADFQQGMALLNKLPAASNGHSKAVVLSTWAVAEARAGNCGEVDRLVGEVVALADDPGLTPQLRGGLKQTLAGGLSAQTRCRWNAALLAIEPPPGSAAVGR